MVTVFVLLFLQRAKKVFDPSEGGLGVAGRKKAVHRCDVCFQSVGQHAVQEDLLVCHRCSARGKSQGLAKCQTVTKSIVQHLLIVIPPHLF